MKNETLAFLKKTLTSRKFWASVTASIPFAQMGDWNSFAMVWMGYAGIQGTVDAVEKLKPQGGAFAGLMPGETVEGEGEDA